MKPEPLDLAKLRQDNGGRLPAYAWPGGYPLFYLCADGGTLCPDCANGPEVAAAHAAADGCPDDRQWLIVATDANWENPAMYCDHCAKQIPSAYADDDAAAADEAAQ